MLGAQKGSSSLPAKHHLWLSLPPLCRPGFGGKLCSRGRAPFGVCGAPGFGSVGRFLRPAVLSWPALRQSPADA